MRMERTIDVIASGHLCLDLIPQMDHVPLAALSAPGKLYEIGPLAISTGGSVSNTGLALHRLGANVRLMATVGDDLLGQIIIAFLRERDPLLAEMIAVKQGHASSYTIVLSPEKGTDCFALHRHKCSLQRGRYRLSFVGCCEVFSPRLPADFAGFDRR
jgi:Sugar kinases, ribokinase family